MRIIVDFIPTQKSSIAQNVVYGCVAFLVIWVISHSLGIPYDGKNMDIPWHPPRYVIQPTPTRSDHGFLCAQSSRNIRSFPESWGYPYIVIIHFDAMGIPSSMLFWDFPWNKPSSYGGTPISGNLHTLWWTNIAMENGHRNSGFSH